jgi:hypothetical protein
MLLAHAATLAEARSYLAALADTAHTFGASVGYERALLHLDAIHGDDVPPLTDVLTVDATVLYHVAEASIEELADHGVDPLQVEITLVMLEAARDLDQP